MSRVSSNPAMLAALSVVREKELGSIVNLFLQNSALYWIITYVGILVFVGLTAYDTQKLKRMAAAGLSGEAERKASIIGALRLYLDFINLFLMLLRVMGRRR